MSNPTRQQIESWSDGLPKAVHQLVHLVQHTRNENFKMRNVLTTIINTPRSKTAYYDIKRLASNTLTDLAIGDEPPF